MPDGTTITLAIILTAAGAVVGAALVTGFVEILKAGLGSLTDGHELQLAFLLSAVLVVAAYVSQNVPVSAEGIFAAIIAWYGIARLAKAHYDDVARRPGSLTNPSADVP